MTNATNAKNARTATIACASAAALALSPAVALAAPMTSAQPARAAATQSAYIGAKKAKAIALKAAGFTEKDCRYIDADLDLDDGPAHYDVDFKVGNREYEYDINALTGEVMSYEVEFDD